MRVALFDVDGTLIRGQSYAYLLRWLWRRGWRRARRQGLHVLTGTRTSSTRASGVHMREWRNKGFRYELSCELDVQPGMGRRFPPDFPATLERAVNFILG